MASLGELDLSCNQVEPLWLTCALTCAGARAGCALCCSGDLGQMSVGGTCGVWGDASTTSADTHAIPPSHPAQLTALPPDIGRLANLKILHVVKNRLTCLPPSIGGCSSLVELHAGGGCTAAILGKVGDRPRASFLRVWFLGAVSVLWGLSQLV